MEEHTNFQFCPYTTYPGIYKAAANISEHLLSTSADVSSFFPVRLGNGKRGNKACRSWGEGNQSAPQFFNFPVFTLFPHFLAISILSEGASVEERGTPKSQRSNVSVNCSCAHPLPPATAGNLRTLSVPGSGNSLPKGYPRFLTHTWLLTRNTNMEEFIGKDLQFVTD